MARYSRLAPIAFIAVLLLSSCAERQFTDGKYDDVTQDRLLDDKFNESDMKRIADEMIQSLTSSAVVKELTKPPVVLVTMVKNRTEEHIDMKSLTDKIKVAVLKTGKFRFTEKETRSEISDEIQYQQDGGFVDPTTARKKGKQIGANYFLTGEITDRVQEVGSKKFIYYKCTLNLVNIDTGLLDWSDDKELRKYYTKHTVGF